MKFYLSSLLIILFFITVPAFAQELDCDVKLNVENLTAEGRENLTEFAAQVKQYIDSYKWTKEDFGDYKIKCTIEIFILGVKDNNHYTAQAFIGSQRPIGKTGRNTACVRIKADKWEFDYVRSQAWIHDDFRFDALCSFIDFYAYVILGFDFDSYRPFDGTKYFNKAMEIVNKSRSGIGAGTTWQSTSQSTYSRAQLMDDILGPKNLDVRKAYYTYHYNGLDLLETRKTKAHANMIAAIESIGKLKDNLNQQTVLMRLFFDTKAQELAESFQNYSDKSVYETFAKVDQNHQKIYEEYSRK